MVGCDTTEGYSYWCTHCQICSLTHAPWRYDLHAACVQAFQLCVKQHFDILCGCGICVTASIDVAEVITVSCSSAFCPYTHTHTHTHSHANENIRANVKSHAQRTQKQLRMDYHYFYTHSRRDLHTTTRETTGSHILERILSNKIKRATRNSLAEKNNCHVLICVPCLSKAQIREQYVLRSTFWDMIRWIRSILLYTACTYVDVLTFLSCAGILHLHGGIAESL